MKVGELKRLLEGVADDMEVCFPEVEDNVITYTTPDKAGVRDLYSKSQSGVEAAGDTDIETCFAFDVN